MTEVHPKEIKGAWDQGYVLDVHTVSSTLIGHNEFGHPEFDTVRSPLGELVYRLKYRTDKTSIPAVVGAAAAFVNSWGIKPEVIVPMPPSKQRNFQPVLELAKELAGALKLPLNANSLKKTNYALALTRTRN